MVDLAGADFDDRDLGSSTSSTTAQQRKESIDINKSLLALKECFRYDSNKISNKLANLRRHASQVHFAKTHFPNLTIDKRTRG